jgi:hypothetical protein
MLNKFSSSQNQSVNTYPLYKGEVMLNFSPFGHRYSIGEREIVGVTTILKTVIAKEALIAWAVKLSGEYMLQNFKPDTLYNAQQIKELIKNATLAHKKEVQKAGNIGKYVHEWIEKYIQAKMYNEDPPEKPEVNLVAINSFLKWEKENNVKFHQTEKVVYSRRYDYAGTLDFIAEVNGVKVIGDFKTSNYIYPESYFLQLSAYKYALDEELKHTEEPNDIKGMLIVRIPKTKDSQTEIMFVPEYMENAKAFIYGLLLYRQIIKIKNFNKKRKGGEKNDK